MYSGQSSIQNPSLFFTSGSFNPPTIDCEYQAYFESKLSIPLINQPQMNRVVQLVSEAIVELIKNHKDDIEILFNEKLFKEFKRSLDEKRFLGLFPEGIKNTLSEILNDIQQILSDKNSKIKHVMPLHSAFGYYVIKNLKTQLKDYAGLHKKAYVDDSSELYDDIQFKKILVSSKVKPLAIRLGILPLKSKYYDSIGSGDEAHIRAVDEFTIDRHQHKKLIHDVFHDENIPLVAGPSKHALNALSSAYALILNESLQFEQYGLYYAAYLIASGHHSFHEVMKMVSFPNFNGRYLVNQYEVYLSQSGFINTKEYAELVIEFENTPWLGGNYNQIENVKVISSV